MYWAEALSQQTQNHDLAEKFRPVADAMRAREAQINEELIGAQGKAQEIGGYYHPDSSKLNTAMRPSNTLNGIISSLQ